MKKFIVKSEYHVEFGIEFKEDITKREVAKLLKCKEEEIHEEEKSKYEQDSKWMQTLMQTSENVPIKMHMTPMKLTQETPAMQAAIEQWKKQKLTTKQIETLKQIAEEHANPPTTQKNDEWTE